MADYYNSLSDDAKLTADEYMMNYVASLRDRDEIQNFSLSRFSDKMVGVVKGAIDFASIAAGILLSAVGAPLVAVVVAPLLLEAINVKICLEQENNAEAVLRIIGMAVGAGIGIKNIVKAGTSAFKAVAATYVDDVARAISKYGDDGIKIAQEFGEETAEKCLKLADDAVEAAGKIPKPGDLDFIGPLKEVDAARAANWTKPDGSTWWPDKHGFVGTPSKTTLQPGIKIDRYGNPSGKFAAPEGTPYGQRSLAPGSQNSPYNSYEVVKPFDVNSGTTASWFDQPGGGTQYQLPMSINDLIRQGYIR